MKILALDTATEACSAALLIDGRLIARETEFERGHAEHILFMVDAVLAEGGVSLNAIDALAFGRGPGAFTGVRLAASVAQGLAFAADRPVVPISDLAAVAQRALDLEPATSRVLVCNDARMQEVYWACFERGPEEGADLISGGIAAGASGGIAAGAASPGSTAQLPPLRARTLSERGAPGLVAPEHAGPPVALPPPQTRAKRGTAVLVGAEHVGPPASVTLPLEWNAGTPGAAAGTVGAVGRGFRAHPELRSKLLSPTGSQPPLAHLISDDLLPRAHEIARLAVADVLAGRTLPPEQAIPVYLRDDVARPPPPSRN